MFFANLGRNLGPGEDMKLKTKSPFRTKKKTQKGKKERKKENPSFSGTLNEHT